MKRFVTLALVGAVVLGASSMVYANVCAFDAAPAATILFPFVALDMNPATNGVSTTFSITNVSSEAQIVHVTVWTDTSIAILDFNILLTGYDVISMNIRDILMSGILPVTEVGGHTDDEGVAVNGPVSINNQADPRSWLDPGLDAPEPTSGLAARCPDDNFSGYPGQYDDPIPGTFLGLFEGYLKVSQNPDTTRQHSDDCTSPFSGGYSLVPTPYWVERGMDDPTWMYITADVVWRCNKLFPDSPGYFVPGDDANPSGFARYDNVLMGDMFWTSVDDRLSEASNAVHLEASMNLDAVATTAPSGFPVSFYHRYAVLNDDRSDYREPLPTAWGFRYLGAGVQGIDTDVRVWKGSSAAEKTVDLDRIGSNVQPDTLIATNCDAYTYYAWDEDENVTTVTTVPWSQPNTGEAVIPNLLPLETQEIPIDQFDTPGEYGWMLFVWPASNYFDAGAGLQDDFYQTWMGVRYEAEGQWSAAMDAAVMANFNCFSDQVLPNLGINYQYASPAGYVVSPGN